MQLCVAVRPFLGFRHTGAGSIEVELTSLHDHSRLPRPPITISLLPTSVALHELLTTLPLLDVLIIEWCGWCIKARSQASHSAKMALAGHEYKHEPTLLLHAVLPSFRAEAGALRFTRLMLVGTHGLWDCL